jgi:hypothetical protein
MLKIFLPYLAGAGFYVVMFCRSIYLYYPAEISKKGATAEHLWQ